MAIGEDGEHKNSEKFHSTTHPLLDVDSGSGHLLHEGNKKGFPSKYKTDFTKEEVFSAVLEVCMYNTILRNQSLYLSIYLFHI